MKVCPEPGCDMEFATDRAMAAHRRKHSRPGVDCPLCGRSVKYLARHLKRMHPQRGSKKAAKALQKVLDEHDALVKENKRLRKQAGMETES